MGKASRIGVGAQKNMLKVSPELFQTLKDVIHSQIDENFHEVPCPKPEEIVVSKRPPSLKEQIQRLIRVEMSQEMADQGMETFEEANDFDMPDIEPDVFSPYELPEQIEEVPIASAPSPPPETPQEPAPPDDPVGDEPESARE